MDRPIYHITHIENLPGILADGCLISDEAVRKRGAAVKNIGYMHIKDRRMRRPIRSGPEGTLGQYVPFNFCSRSVMLYVISRGHQDYGGGQDEIIHLVSSVDTVIASGQSFVFTDIHADLDYANHFDDRSKLDGAVDWSVMDQKYWSETEVKKKRQAEFLVWKRLPWTCVSKIGVKSKVIADRVTALLAGAPHKPPVEVRADWYYS